MAEQHYCLAKMATEKKAFHNILENLPKAKARYDKYAKTKRRAETLAELHMLVTSLFSRLAAIISLLNELEDSETAALACKLMAALKKYDYLNADYSKLCMVLEVFEKKLPTEEQAVNSVALGRLMNRVKMGYFPTDFTHVDLIRNAVVFPKTSVNLLDPCCGCGLALERLAQGSNTITYGAEIDDCRSEQAQERIDRIATGSFFRSFMSHNAFHFAFLNPPYLSVMNESGGNSRLEKTFLAETIPHIMIGGLLVYIIPYYRMTEDICRVLAGDFEKLSVYRFLESEFKKFKQVAVFGQKKKRCEDMESARDIFNMMLNPEQIPSIFDLQPETYLLPDREKCVDIFKGAVFNVRELESQFSKSKSASILFDSSQLEKIEKRPPLPLNVSQIGLIGGSGMMNGLVECDTPHVVKGRIVKQQKTELTTSSPKGEKAELRVVTSNRMIFNILTPNGFKSLT